MHAGMSAGTHLIGCKVDLITKAEIRYRGTVYQVDNTDATITLAKVRSFGTENRPVSKPIPPRNETYEFIIFRGSDIKDIKIIDQGLGSEPKDPAPQDPSILSTTRVPPQSTPPPASQPSASTHPSRLMYNLFPPSNIYTPFGVPYVHPPDMMGSRERGAQHPPPPMYNSLPAHIVPIHQQLQEPAHPLQQDQLPRGPTPSVRVPHSQTVDRPLSRSNMASGLDVFDKEGLSPIGGQDFGSKIRDKVLGEHNKKDSLTEFEGTCEGVTVVEVTGRGLCLLWSKGTSIEWVFEITTISPHTLHSVTLFDSFLADYDITGVYLITQTGQQKLPGVGKCEKGVGLLLNQRFSPSDKIQIKVTLVPRSGLLGQLVVFDFGSFTMIRGLAVHVLTEQESRMLDTVALKKKKAKKKPASAGGRCSIRFQLGRIPMRSMHFAVDNLDLSTIFPESLIFGTMNEHRTAVLRCLEELKRSELNKNQQDAVTSMLDPVCTKIPSLVLGPFGCGKTRTLSECIKLLALWVQDARILICTPDYGAANLYVEGLNREWKERLNSKAPLFRLYYTGRETYTISPTIRQYCKFNEKGQLSIPSLAELQSHKIVVTNTFTSRSLLLVGLPKGHFTHIFIDGATQALESECIIPLCLAGEHTKVVLAGDHMQMDPPVYSPIARKYGLHISLLERLYDHEAYDSGIMKLPSKLFYKNKLTCKAVLPNTGPQDIPPIKFVGVNGRERQTEDSPSYYNDDEVLKVVEQVQLLVNGGLNTSEICVVSYYRLQVQRIRHALRQRKLGSVAAVRAAGVQGREFRALILSTVRTCSTEPSEEEEAGFLTNPKMFNTVVTRAKQWLVVVGEPFTLCMVGESRLCWMEFIRLCQTLKSFDYTNTDQFVEESLDYKIVVRQLLEKVHSSFFSPNKPPTLTPAAYSQAGPQKQMEILRSKVKQVTLGGDDPTIKKITDELMRLSVEQQVGLIAKPELFAVKVKEIEQVFRRAGPTAAILASNGMEVPLISQPTLAIAQGVPRPPSPQGSKFNVVPEGTRRNMPPRAEPVANPTESEKACPGATLDDLFYKYNLKRTLLDCEVQREHLLRVSRLLEDWKEFARAAGLTEPEIVAIDRDEQTENGRRFKALHVWHKKNAYLATNRELIRIMLCINGGDVAQKACMILKGDERSATPGTQPQSSNVVQVSDDLVLFKNDPIGGGAFGTVFKGEFNKQSCAVKLLHSVAYEIKTSLPVSEHALEDSVSRFQKECEYLESFVHPNIVRHLATRMYRAANNLVLALELMDCNLRQYFTPQPGKDHVKLSLTVQSSLCLDIASALEYIHSQKVVHRDLCSDNILLVCEGETPVAKVCDFGMSRILKSEAHSISLQAFAHKGYMPPEATDMESSSYNTKFDIFSFGALMVQIVRHLPTIKDRREQNNELDSIATSHPIKTLICQCLRENRDDRPSATQLKRKLLPLVTSQPPK